MQTNSPTPAPAPASADSCTASLQAAVKKVLHSAAFGKFVSSAMGAALADSHRNPVYGEIVLAPPTGCVHQGIRAAFDGHSVAMEITDGDGGETLLFRDYQPRKGSSSFSPATWWGCINRRDQYGRRWSKTFSSLVCDDFGDLVVVAA